MRLTRIPELHPGKLLFSISAEPGFATKAGKGTVVTIGIGGLSRWRQGLENKPYLIPSALVSRSG